MGAVERSRHPRARLRARTTRPTPPSRPSWPSCSPTTTTPSWPRTSNDETAVSYGRLRDALAAQTGRALVHPVFFGSAITGAGVDALIGRHHASCCPRRRADARRAGRPARSSRSSGARRGRRSPTCGCSPGRARDLLRSATGVAAGEASARAREGKVTAISVFDRGSAVRARGRRRADRQAVGARRHPDRRRDRRAGATQPRREWPATTSPRRRWRRSSSRAAAPTGARCTSRSPSSPSRTR